MLVIVKLFVLLTINFLTKWPEAYADSSTEAHVIAELLVKEILPRHGPLRILLSDRETKFLSKLDKEVCRLMNTKKMNTTAYHPQTNALVEHFNGTPAQAISMFVSTDQKDWDSHIPSFRFAYRVTKS